MAKMKMTTAGKVMMLEKGNMRYEFFALPIKKSNINSEVAYYEPVVRHCKKLVGGSTYVDYRVSVEGGNEFFKDLLMKGYRRVAERSWC